MTAEKLHILDKIADALNASGVTWGVGASLLLYSHGLAEDFHDIDLLVAEQDVHRADEILRSLGEKRPFVPNPAYGTRYFYEYVIDGLEVDLMCELVILSETGDIRYSFTEGCIGRTLRLRGADIPFCRLEDWQRLYAHMPGKAEKAERIAKFLSGDA